MSDQFTTPTGRPEAFTTGATSIPILVSREAASPTVACCRSRSRSGSDHVSDARCHPKRQGVGEDGCPRPESSSLVNRLVASPVPLTNRVTRRDARRRKNSEIPGRNRGFLWEAVWKRNRRRPGQSPLRRPPPRRATSSRTMIGQPLANPCPDCRPGGRVSGTGPAASARRATDGGRGSGGPENPKGPLRPGLQTPVGTCLANGSVCPLRNNIYASTKGVRSRAEGRGRCPPG
jgi:hypothetical protein